MKFWLLGAFLVCLGASAHAQDVPVATPSTFGSDVALAQAAIASVPSGKWAGKLDLTNDFSLGGWQSVKSADEAYGLSKPIWSLQKGGQQLVNLGLFIGGEKPLNPLVSSAPRLIGGATIAVPGSTLDWALGTKMGDAWIPKLKTGVLCAWDLLRVKRLGTVPDFVGIGASYPLF